MQTVPHCPAKWTFFHVLAHCMQCAAPAERWAAFLCSTFSVISDAILHLLLREIYPCWHSTLVNVCTEEDEDDPYFDSSAFFSFYKTALKLSESEEKGQCDGHSTRIFSCYYAHSYWILVKTKIRKNGQILEAVCTLIRDWRNWFSKNCWIHISQCKNFVFFSLLWWNKNIQVGTLT